MSHVKAKPCSAHLSSAHMLRVGRISGQKLPSVSLEEIHDVNDLKCKRRVRHCISVCLQQLLYNGNNLENSTVLPSLLLDHFAKPGSRDTSVDLQLVLLSASAAAKKHEVPEEFHEACKSGMEAAWEGHVQFVQLLLQVGAGKNLQDQSWATALMHAAGQGQTEIVQLLLQVGADKDLLDWVGTTALKNAASKGCTEIAQLLLQAGADVDSRNWWSGTTALMEAAGKAHTKITQLLLQASAGKDLQDAHGTTALREAGAKGHKETVRLLLEAGASNCGISWV